MPTRLFSTILLLLLGIVLAGAGAPARAQAAEQQEPAFDVFEYVVEGNTRLSQIAIERAVYRHMGPGKRIADVERARAALENAYRDAGYSTVVVDIPVQKVDAGAVILAVTEGRIERVRVTGARYFSQGAILERAEAVVQAQASGEAPYFPDVQRALDRLNRGGDRRVVPVLRPGTLPGTTELELRVDDKLPVHGSVELNNRYSPGTTPLRLGASLRYDNFLERGHSLGMQVQTSPADTKQVQVFLGTYVVPLEKGTVYGYYVNSKSNVAAIGDAFVLGKGSIIGLRYNRPLPRVGQLSHSVTAGVDWKNFAENITQPGTPGQQTPLHYAPFSLDWSGQLESPTARTQFSLGAVVSARNVGNDPLQFDTKRFNASPNFVALRADATRTQPVFGDYSMVLAAAGQLADQPLVSNEQFFAGGANTVRGYLESEAIGDDGLRGSAELRSPNLMSAPPPWLRELRWFSFVDAAHLRVREALPFQTARVQLSSVGYGLRMRSFDSVEALLTIGWPFRGTRNTVRMEPRIQFSLKHAF